jgi:hypothetical protein
MSLVNLEVACATCIDWPSLVAGVNLIAEEAKHLGVERLGALPDGTVLRFWQGEQAPTPGQGSNAVPPFGGGDLATTLRRFWKNKVALA